MDKIWYKIVGWVLIIGGILTFISHLYGQWCIFSTCSVLDQLYEYGFGLWPVLIIALSFLPGRLYLKIADKKVKENRLIKWGLVISIIAILWIVISLLLSIVITIGTGDNSYGAIILFTIFGIIPAGIIYGVSILLLIINWFRNR